MEKSSPTTVAWVYFVVSLCFITHCLGTFIRYVWLMCRTMALKYAQGIRFGWMQIQFCSARRTLTEQWIARKDVQALWWNYNWNWRQKKNKPLRNDSFFSSAKRSDHVMSLTFVSYKYYYVVFILFWLRWLLRQTYVNFPHTHTHIQSPFYHHHYSLWCRY